MGKKPVITAAEAAKMVQDGMTFTTSGFVASAMPEALNKALEQRFLESGSPKDLTLFYAAAQGNRDGSGADHFAHEGMLKRVIGGHYNMVPELGKLINADKLEAYNLPQGTLSQLYRDIAGHKVGHITHVGLNTFADPRIEGGKLNRVTTEDIVEVVEVLGEERLLYKALKFDIGFIRGSYADENGNVTLEHECCTLEATSIAQAVKNSGGKVVVQVEKVVQHGDLDPKLVKIPGIYVDAIVVCENKEDHAQCQGCEYDGSMTGDFHVPLGSLEYPPMSAKKIIGRRAAMELQPDKVVNLGIGIPEYISMVANEEGIGDYMTLTVEAGQEKALEMALAILRHLRDKSVLEKCQSVDVSDPSVIAMEYDGRFRVLIPWEGDTSYKLDCMLTVIDTKLEDNERGTLDLTREAVHFIPG